MGTDIRNDEYPQQIQIAGRDEDYLADVINDTQGTRRLTVSTKLVGADGNYEANVSENGDVFVNDVLNTDAADTIITVTSATPVELKVGGSNLSNRKYVIFSVQTVTCGCKVMFGTSSSTQSIRIFKYQIIMIPVGENNSVYFSVNTGTATIGITEWS